MKRKINETELVKVWYNKFCYMPEEQNPSEAELTATQEQEKAPEIGEEDIRSFIHRIEDQTALMQKYAVRDTARKLKISEDYLLETARRYAAEKIKRQEKGVLYHYHKTNLDALRTIAEDGTMLSRTELQKRHPDMQISGWSSSDDIMMSRDKYDSQGNLTEPGISNYVIAAGDATLVFKPTIMDRKGYNPIGRYPTISNIPVADYTEAVLARDSSAVPAIKEILQQNAVSIPVQTQAEWRQQHYASSAAK